MATTIDDLAAPEFAGIRADLARLYLQHRDVLGMAGQPDSFIVDRIDDITAVLIGLTARALMNQDRAWLVNAMRVGGFSIQNKLLQTAIRTNFDSGKNNGTVSCVRNCREERGLSLLIESPK